MDFNSTTKAQNRLRLSDYQQRAKKSDKNPETILSKKLILPLLGLFGETGSLLSEAKKKKREARAHIGFTEGVTEELGDALWYTANIASQFSLKLEDLANSPSVVGAKYAPRVKDFIALSERVERTLRARTSLDRELLALAGHVGDLANDAYTKSLHADPAGVSSHLSHILHSIVCVAIKANVSINNAALFNLWKIQNRWPLKHVHHPLFDEQYMKEEQLPRKLDVHFKRYKSGGKTFVIQQIGGVNIGDRLTDNIDASDDYKYHDVFHWAYAAILGWSPVIRGLLRCKRKSNPSVDENQDGARAAIMEEALSVWIFHHARNKDFFRGLESLDYSLLKAAKTLVKGYEVEKVPLWQLERAILEGFRVFRALRAKGSGIISVDLKKRSIEFREL